MRKPDRPAFEAVADTTGFSISSLLFFDDTMENIEGAREAGLHAVLVRSPMDVQSAFCNFKLL